MDEKSPNPNTQAATDQPAPTTVDATKAVGEAMRADPNINTDMSAEAVRAREQSAEMEKRRGDAANNYVAKVFPVGELRCTCGNVERIALVDADGNELKPEDVQCSNCGSTPKEPMSHDEAHSDLPSWRKHRQEQERAAAGARRNR